MGVERFYCDYMSCTRRAKYLVSDGPYSLHDNYGKEMYCLFHAKKIFFTKKYTPYLSIFAVERIK